MFVEGVRLFVVVLCTAIGYWADRAAGGLGGVGGTLGCLFGYVTGGFFGRMIERALGAVERRVEPKSPAQFIAGTLGAIVGGAFALVLVVPVALLLSPHVTAAFAGLSVWIMGWLG